MVNSLPYDKILESTKLKEFADDRFNRIQMMISVFDSVESIVGNRENPALKQFLHVLQCFKSSLSESLKWELLGKR